MEKSLLTLIGVASLTIAAITAKSEEVNLPVLGRDVSVGGVTTHYGAPVLIPDTTSGGKWVPFPIRPLPTGTTSEARYELLLAEVKNEIFLIQTPTVSLENGRVVGKAVLGFNHDGRVYAGLIIHRDTSADDPVHDDLAARQKEYQENIKSGKWRKFVNGE